MFAASLFASLSFLGATSAAVINTRLDPHRCDFRTYGVEGCFNQNQGVYTLQQSDAGPCKQFVEPIGSMMNVDISGGCTLYVYSDTDCAVEATVVPTQICQNKAFQSYRLDCPSS